MEPPADVPTQPGFDSLAGTHIADRYDVHDLIGVGGTCEVYLATDTLLDIPVALKRVRPDYVHRKEFRKRMIKEARRGRIPDPRIAAIHEVVTWGDELMLVMEYVKGESLTKRIERGLSLDDFWRMAKECLEALRAAHDKGLIHRDIKPDNIMVTEGGSIKMLDFGLAHRISGVNADLGASTASLAVPAGTPRYMSPEAYRGAELDERADIFSLGVVFYQMLCGMPPFQARNWSELNDEILHFDPPPPCKNRRVSNRLSGVVMTMIAKKPEDRFASCDEVLAALLNARKGDLPLRQIGFGILALAVIGLALVAPEAIRTARDYFRPPIPSPTVLVVMPFEWEGADASEEMLAVGLSEIIREDLALHRDPAGYTVVPAEDPEGNPLTEPEDTREALGANVAVLGSINQVGRELRAQIMLVDTGPAQRQLRSSSIAAESGYLRDLAQEAQVALRAMLELPEFGMARWDRIHGSQADGPFRLHLQGLAALRADSLDIAIAALTQATQIDRKYASAHAALALALLPKSEFDSALSHAATAIRLDPLLPAGRMALADVQQARGETAAAKRSLRETLALENAPLDAWIDLCDLIGSEDVTARNAVIEDAVQRWPGWARPLNHRAYYRYVAGTIDAAMEDYGEMARLSPENYYAWYPYGALLILKGDYEEGIEACQTALEIRRDGEAFTNLGVAYFNLRRFQESAQAYQNGLQAGGEDYVLWMSLGDAYAMYDPAEAVRAYERAIQLALEDDDPNKAWIISDLARLYARLGRLEEAQTYLDEALRSADLDYQGLQSCGLAAWDLDQPDLAISLLARSVEAGMPRAWVRSSPMYDEWRQNPGFAAVLGEGTSRQ